MDRPTITCAQVDERDLDIRYLAHQLSEEEAEAFEAHYFGCDRCWALVRGGVATRAGAMPAPAAARRPARFGWPRVLALAAGIGAVAIGLWRLGAPDGAAGPDTLRGAADSLPVTAELAPPAWRATWPAVEGATRYRVRVFTEDGTLRLEREVADTAIAGDAAELGIGEAFYVDVEALDATRRPAARSPLTRLRASAGSAVPP